MLFYYISFNLLMYVCYEWFNFDAQFLLLENRIPDNSAISEQSVDNFFMYISNLDSLRISFSFSIDWCMLYNVIVSLFQYLSRFDNIKCSRYNDNFVVLFDIQFSIWSLNNLFFYFLFYISVFMIDLNTDMDCIYQFWTHSRGRYLTNTNSLHYSSRNIALDDAYHAYFMSNFDANLLYSVNIESVFCSHNSVLSSLIGSLYYVSFSNINLNSYDG